MEEEQSCIFVPLWVFCIGFFVLSLIGWAVIPFSNYTVLSNINLGILYLFAISGLSVYGIVIAGWSSNSKYPFLGALRSAAQMISYEVSIGFIIVNVCVCVGSFNLSSIVLAQQNTWFIIPLFPMFILFYIYTHIHCVLWYYYW